MGEIIRIHTHIRHAVMPRYRIDPLLYNEEYGINFLNGELTEQEFKSRLQRADKRMQHAREAMNVLEMTTATISDIIGRFHQKFLQEQNGMPIITKQEHVELYERIYTHCKILYEIFPLLEYTNECLDNIAGIYGYKSHPSLALDMDIKFLRIDDLYKFMPEFEHRVRA